ncbi:hypothetical protein CAPTEDRAFT_178694 [Capitella teleta]|uniref:Uncharacterized protein n=1 Tax=Capitella teleta TaxID=283909 RepID=R7UUK9_CAPTE|nr:hypothetical protein CAPTEDRAFT_178694 [Capitella teleta]|eukprot:ELU09880.1 hypothetical protein CAPTEDRAFT_178694 [Capitella teleta]
MKAFVFPSQEPQVNPVTPTLNLTSSNFSTNSYVVTPSAVDRLKLSECFLLTVCAWVPCLYLFLTSAFYIPYLFRLKNKCIPHSGLNIAKTVLSGVLLLLVVIHLFKRVYDNGQGVALHPIYVIEPVLNIPAMILAAILIQLGRFKGVRSTGVLFIYWLLQSAGALFILRERILDIIELVRLLTSFVLFNLLYVPTPVSVRLCQKLTLGIDFVGLQNECPERAAGFLSVLSFWWFTRLITRGYRQDLTTEDLWLLNDEDCANEVYPRLEKQWKSELHKQRESQQHDSEATKCSPEEIHLKSDVDVVQPAKETGYQPSLAKALVRAFGPQFLVGSSLKFCQDILIFVSPMLLKKLIAFTQNKSQPLWQGYMYAVMMFVTVFTQSMILHQYFHRCFIVGMNLRTAVTAAVYKKALKLSNAAKQKSTVGEIVNLMSVDAQRFMELTTYLNMLWSAPLQMLVCLYFLWKTLGPSVLAGVFIMILLIPVNAILAKKNKSLQVVQMKHKDNRIKLMNEILNGIKVLKLYAWELSFEDKVINIRNKELKVLRQAAYLNAASSFTWTCAPFLVSLTTFAFYVLSSENNVLDAEKAFVSLALFNILRFPLSMLPMLIAGMTQAVVSTKRLQDFLKSEELDERSVAHDSANQGSFEAVHMQHGTFAWENGQENPTLHDMTLSVKKGEFVAIVGTVGSGKSSLVSAMLGEMRKLQGNVSVNGSVAYVAQQAWIQNASLRENILFGQSMREEPYQKILDACSLGPDLEILPGGDLTEIGEKGINISGGQKQRVSLARAVYSDTDIYLLDDPLSAVDSHVGKHIFSHLLDRGGLLQDKTRILVTHGISFLPKVDRIVVLKDGRISEVGTFEELLDANGAFAEFLRTYLVNHDEDDDVISEEGQDGRLISSRSSLGSKHNLKGSLAHLPAAEEKDKEGNGVIHLTEEKDQEAGKKDEEKEKDRLIQAEKAETGRVKFSVFWAYMQSVGLPISFAILAFYFLNTAASVGANFWLSAWSNDIAVNGTQDMAQRDLRLGVYGALGLAQAIAVWFAGFARANGALLASRLLHAELLTHCLRSPIEFFDTTPIGRILNRFSKDIDTVDNAIPNTIGTWLMCVFQVVAMIVVIGSSTPYFLVVAAVLSVFYIAIQRFFVATSRQLKRLESVSRSPIYSHFGETVQGASTIRAYAQQDRFMRESDGRVDANQICYYPSIVANRWLAVRLEFVGNCIVMSSALFAVLGRDHLTGGIVGLSISYALNITQTLNWMVRMTSELETNIVAVERVKEYSETPTEADWVKESCRPSKYWPQSGVVEFKEYTTRYREGLDLVLKGLTCQIQGGEKIGIVGRTGAGKSSLTLALFRIIESAGGSITIDGMNVADMGLHDLRGRLTIIPQDPVLFSGSLRMNLDPFDAHTDDEIWLALEHAHLKTFVKGLPEELQHECTEGGENLSVGQRQLVCLARALLRKTRILVLDEATAAVDLETDDLIQGTIRTQFEECTVLTIAHRLNTIMDYTRVMVLSNGCIKEFDTPKNLLSRRDSEFYAMVKDAGLVTE